MSKLISVFILTLLSYSINCYALRDPTRPPAEQMAKWISNEDKRFAIHSILRGVDHHHVVINGKVLKVGDVISGVKVLKISEQSVQLMEGPKVFEVSIYQKVKEPSQEKKAT